MAISALSQDGHESRSECLFIPVWRPIHDPRVKSHDFQCPANNRSRSAEHQVPVSVRLDVILGPHQSTDAAGIYEREVRQIDNERQPAMLTRVSVRPSAAPTSNSPCSATRWRSGSKSRVVKLNTGNTANFFSAEGCRWHVARRSISCSHATPVELSPLSDPWPALVRCRVGVRLVTRRDEQQTNGPMTLVGD